MTEADSRPKQPRWGVRALLFLTLAFLSVLTSNALLARDVDDYVVFTFLSTVGGLAGAAYCSIRGLRTGGWLTRH
ncbi:MAG: hypothetical protein ACXWDI_03780 [Nocardioides sp.]